MRLDYNPPVPMDEPSSHPPSDLALTAAILAVGGWLGLVLLFNFAEPTLGPRWLFYALWTIALTGTAIPFVIFLNRRFAGTGVAPNTLLRQSLWVGVFGATLAWLRLSDMLSPLIAVLVAAALAAMEWVLRLRERSRWTPGD